MAKITDIYALQIRTFDDVKNLMVSSKERILEVYNDITGTVIADNTLTNLNSTSNTAIWRLWSFITAIQIWLHEFLWIRYRFFLEEAARFAQPHTAAWYQQRALEFQSGDTLVIVNGAVVYNPVNVANRIVTAASVKETNGQLIVKVAKTVSSQLTALSSAELTDFSNYIDRMKDAGVIANTVSQNADVLKLIADVIYDPSISLATFQTNLEAAINSYVQNLPFDGVFRRIKLIDAMQSVEGFVDVNISSLQASISYTVTPSFSTINLSYETVAGYMNIDSNFPLNSSLTFTPNV